MPTVHRPRPRPQGSLTKREANEILTSLRRSSTTSHSLQFDTSTPNVRYTRKAFGVMSSTHIDTPSIVSTAVRSVSATQRSKLKVYKVCYFAVHSMIVDFMENRISSHCSANNSPRLHIVMLGTLGSFSAFQYGRVSNTFISLSVPKVSNSLGVSANLHAHIEQMRVLDTISSLVQSSRFRAQLMQVGLAIPSEKIYFLIIDIMPVIFRHRLSG